MPVYFGGYMYVRTPCAEARNVNVRSVARVTVFKRIFHAFVVEYRTSVLELFKLKEGKDEHQDD